MSSSTKIDNWKKNILILSKGPTQGLEHTGANSYLLVNGIKTYNFKAKDSEIVPSLLCLGNVSKDWKVDNLKKTGLNGCFLF